MQMRINKTLKLKRYALNIAFYGYINIFFVIIFNNIKLLIYFGKRFF